MKLLVAAGGTGGHIFPALAVAREWKRREPQREVVLVGTPRGAEMQLVPQAGFQLETLRVGGLKGIRGRRRLRHLFLLPGSLVTAARIVRRHRPAVVLGTGGYVAGPVLLAAAMTGVPTVAFEPNVRAGFTNRLLRHWVRRLAVAYPETARELGPRAVVTGCPVRPEFFEAPEVNPGPPFVLLVTGGSQGAQAINRAMVEALPLLATLGTSLTVLHQTGSRDYEQVRAAYAAHGIAAEVQPFFEDMPQRFARATLLVCRAGAVTVAEVAAAGRPAIFVPFAAATDAHQWHNAMAMVRAGAGRLIPQAELTGQRLASEIIELLRRPELLRELGRRARERARPDATAAVVSVLEEVCRR